MSKTEHSLPAFLPTQDWLVVGWVLMMKVLLFTFGAISFRIFQNQTLIGLRSQFDGAGELIGNEEFFFVILGLMFTIAGWFRLRPSYATWMTGNWLLFASTSYMQAVPRYTLTLFPVFILFALLGANRF